MSDWIVEPPKYHRAKSPGGTALAIERTGGDSRAGIIRNVSLATVGEALGHYEWLDQEFIEQVTEFAGRFNQGLKSRFAHPNLSGDGLGTFLGRIKNVRTEDNRSIGDLHFSRAAHSTPDGNLADYTMDLANEDPEAFGLSIVFMEDREAMQEFREENPQSPDAANTQNLPHLRLADLRAADAVDEPAANPDGLFRRGQATVVEAEAVACYALGLSDQRPSTKSLGIDADRTRGFVSRFLSTHNLEIRQMSNENETPEAPVEEIEEVTPETVETPADPPADAELGERAEAKRFTEHFGEKGAVWFAEGLSFEEARTREMKELREKLAVTEQKLSASPVEGELDPIELTTSEEDVGKRKGLASRIRIRGAENNG